jgi:hypothetical protein
MPKSNTYLMLVDWDNGSTEYIESRNKEVHTKRLKALRRNPSVEYVRVLENPKHSYIWINPDSSPEGEWI